jgi:hypothetical protein
MIKQRVMAILMALGVGLGLTLVSPVAPAQAASTAWIGNGWSQPIGVWDQNNNLWYPINSGTNTLWTLSQYTAVNMGPHSYCRIHYFGDPDSTSWYFSNTSGSDFHYHIGVRGLVVTGCGFTQ